MELELTNGKMEEFTLDNGKIILCMGEVFIHGLMVGDIKDIIKMIRNMEKEHIIGQTVENMQGNGKMENKMARVNIL